jgi:hypothetical protein
VETGGDDGYGDGYIIETTGGIPRKVCESCAMDLWTRDNRHVVVHEPGWKSLIRVDVASGTRLPLVTTSSGELDRPMFEPKGRWFTFNGPGAIYVAPANPDGATPDAEWTKLIDVQGAGERTAGLSPDGSLVYLLLERDGFRCLYAMRLDPGTGQRRGDPFPVAHFHDATRHWGSTGLGSAVARGIFLADLYETTGNIWMTTLHRQR